MKNHFDIVIRCRNCWDQVDNLLNQISRQTCKPSKIIIVDNSDEIPTRDIDENVCIIRYPKDEEFNFSKSLNIGMNLTSSPVVAIVSPHIKIIRSDTLEVMLRGLDELKCCGVYAAREGNDITFNNAESEIVPLWTMISIDNYSGFNALHNTFSMIRRDLWVMHPFVEWLNSTEDQEWAIWNYNNTKYPTAVLRSHKYYYLNRLETKYKIVREYLLVGHYFYPPFFSIKSLLKICFNGFRSLLSGDYYRAITAIELIIGIIFAKRLVNRFSCRVEEYKSVLSHLW